MTQSNNIEKVVLKIQEMSCSSCANKIEKELKSAKGVVDVNLNFATEKAQVAFNKEITNIEELTKVVEDIGYGAIPETTNETEKVALKIVGMTCTACSNTIEKGLNKMEGIKSASVNFAVEKVMVEYDPKKIRMLDMQKKVSELGYQLILEETHEDDGIDEDEEKIMKIKRIMQISVALSSVIMTLMVIHMFVTPIPGYIPIVAILGFPIVFGTGWHVHVGSFKALKNKSPNMDVLVTLGSMPPYLIGLMALFLPLQSFIEMATTIMTFHRDELPLYLLSASL